MSQKGTGCASCASCPSSSCLPFIPFDEGAASEGTCDLSEPAFDPVGILFDPGAGGTKGPAAAAAEPDFSGSTSGRYVVARTGLLDPGGVAERLLS